MQHRNNRVIIWSTDVINLIEGEPIGGVAVQLFFWAQTFCEHGWEVYSFSERHRKPVARRGITFLPKRNIKRINLLSEWWFALRFNTKINPNLIVYRGANRELLPLVCISRLMGAKLLFFSASDVNFMPGNELVGSELNRWCYQQAVRQCKLFVVQNDFQQNTLRDNYGKDSLRQYNIWGNSSFNEHEIPPISDAVWIANFRRLKRAEWVLDAASKLPGYIFVLAGGPSVDVAYYDEIEERANVLRNTIFLGGRSFYYTNELVSYSKVLLCTSSFEGFPNTFLQAWSRGLPVISTVDPSNIIKKNGLGEVVESEEDLIIALKRILEDKQYYKQLQINVKRFFLENHSAETGYSRIIEYLS